MDISAQEFKLGESYKKDDIVKIDELSNPSYVEPDAVRAIGEISLNLSDDNDNTLTTDQEEILTTDLDNLYKKDLSDQISIDSNSEVEYGFLFYVDEEVDYSAQAMICRLYTSPSPRDRTRSRMPSSA